MNIEDLISEEAKREAKKQTKQMILHNDITIIKPLLGQLNSCGVDTSTFINSNDSKNLFIKNEIIYTLKMIIYYLYELYNYNKLHIKMSRPNLKGAIYDRLKLLRDLINNYTYKKSSLINAYRKFKLVNINNLKTREDQHNLKIHIQHLLMKIDK